MKVGIRYAELRDMNVVELINILDAFLPKQKTFEQKYRKATQKDIDMIT